MADFGALPPEINSTRMYSGSGSGPLLASAAAWDALAVELENFAIGISSTLSELQRHSWSGAASSAMAAAAAPYVAWATTTAAQAAETAGRARAAAAAYEGAFAATVPPAVVIANRTLLVALTATNFFGQNTPAIAATEAAYAQMWAQDAAAMYGYATSASEAATLTPFGQPPQTTNPSRQSATAAAVGQTLNTLVGNSPTTLTQLTSATPLSSAAPPDASASSVATAIIDAFAPVTAFDDVLNSTVLGFLIPKTIFQGGSYFLAAQRTGVQGPDLPVHPPAPEGAAATISTWSSPGPSNPVLANVGRGTPVGGLSVPQNWTAATPAAGPVTESAPPAETRFKALPTWANPTHTSAGIPATGQINNSATRRGSNAVYRMRDRRYQMPRPTLGG